MANHLINVTPDEKAWKEAANRWRREFLKMPVLAMGDVTKFMTGLPGCRTNQYLGTVETEAQFYPYVANRRGDGSTAVKFEQLAIFFGSMIHDFVPDDYVQTLLGEHADTLGMGQAKSEMAKLILTTIMQSAGEKLALAIPVAERNDDGNTTMDLFNGFTTLIQNAIIDGKVSEANGNLVKITEPITAANVVDVVKSIEYGLDTRLRRQQRFLFCDPEIVDLYNEGYLLTHPAVPYNDKFEQNYVEGSNRRMTFAPLDGLAGTGIMFVAPKMNVVYGYDGVSDNERFEVLRLKADTFTVNAKMFFGVGFRTFDKRFLKVITVKGGSKVGSGKDLPDVIELTPGQKTPLIEWSEQEKEQDAASDWEFSSMEDKIAAVDEDGIISSGETGSTTINSTFKNGLETFKTKVNVSSKKVTS